MSGLKDKVTSAVTGDAYEKPAKTKDGAFTTQDSADAHTIEGTSADPNSTGSKLGDKAEEAEQKGREKMDNTDSVGDKAQQAKQKGQEAMNN